jgi:hypothetical protein
VDYGNQYDWYVDYAILAGFTDFDKLFRLKEVKIAAKEVEQENYQTYFQFVILV